MKIRTDFVTNSSSYSSSEIMIDNPILLEILQRYKDLGTFTEGRDDLQIGSGEFELPVAQPGIPNELPEEKTGFSKTPAIYAYAEEVGDYPPESLNELIERIIELFYSGWAIMDQGLFSMLEAELNQRKGEIERSFSKVYWEYNKITNEHEYSIDGNAEIFSEFKYDRQNGEKSTFVAYNYDTGEILEER